jgi:hypothetical protein
MLEKYNVKCAWQFEAQYPSEVWAQALAELTLTTYTSIHASHFILTLILDLYNSSKYFYVHRKVKRNLNRKIL